MASTIWLTGAALVLGIGLMGQEPQVDVHAIKPGQAIRIPAGTELPIKVAMRGDVAGVVDGQAPVKLKSRREVWIRYTADSVEASLDGKVWKPFTQVFTGALSFSLSDDEHGGNLQGCLGMELRVRAED